MMDKSYSQDTIQKHDTLSLIVLARSTPWSKAHTEYRADNSPFDIETTPNELYLKASKIKKELG